MKDLIRSWGLYSERRQLWLLFGAALMIRLVGLAAWPDVQADEGLWTNSTRNFVDFDDWFMDGRTHMLLSPLFHLFSLITFWLTSPSIWAARLVSAVCGAASVPLLYGIVRRLTRQHEVAMISAMVLAFNFFAISISRQALIESTEVAMVLASVYMLVRGEWSVRYAAAAGLFFGLAFLAKINIIFMAPVLACYVMWPREGVRWQRQLTVLAVVGVVTAAMLASVYGALYIWEPERFVAAFRFELDGVHFLPDSNPIFRVGRFSLEPVKSAESIIAVFRLMPFLLVLASLGLPFVAATKGEARRLMVPWLAIGVPFYLLQMFQPERYFYLVVPAVAYASGVALVTLARSTVSEAFPIWVRNSGLGVFVAFGVGYSGMSFVANRGVRLPSVVEWVEENTDSSDVIMAAGYFSTDLSRRAYARYHFSQTPADLVMNIDRLGITYVIYDSDQWRDDLWQALELHYRKVKVWSFGAVYRTDQPPDPNEAGGM